MIIEESREGWSERRDRLARTEERLRAVVLHAPIVLFAIDREGILTLSEGNVFHALRRRPGETIGRSVFEIYKEQPWVLTAIRRALDGEEVAAEGEIAGVWFEAHYTPLRDPRNDVSGVIGVATDISARKRAEQGLRFLERAGRRLASSLDFTETLATARALACEQFGSRCSIWLANERGEGHGESPEAEVLLTSHGREVGTLRIARADPPFTPAERSLAEELVRRCASALENSRLYAEVEEHRARLDKLVRELREAIAVREEFLSIASHELKTPLTPMKMQLQKLQRLHARGALATTEPTTVAQWIDCADRSVDRLTRLVEDLLDVSRIAVGKLALEQSEVDLTALVGAIIESFETQLMDSGCAVLLEAPGPVVGRWDRFRMEQVVVNLITNAIKYGHGKPIEVTVEATDALARVTVRDQGIGIAPENHERIFQRFERAVSATQYSGLGLGLYIVRTLVESHGGSIRVESQPGQGSRFVFEVPLSGILGAAERAA